MFSNLSIFKSGAKLNIHVLAALGLVYSFWTQSLILSVFDIRLSSRYANDFYIVTILKSYIIIYLTTTVGLLWGIYIFELRYVKLWEFVKSIEVLFNIASLIACWQAGYIPVIVVVMVLGIYVMMSVWNMYMNLLQTNSTEEKENNVDLSLPKYDLTCEMPAIHKSEI